MIYELDTPVVSDAVPADILTFLASQSLGSLFSATDPAGKTITEWQVYDTATSDWLVVGGTKYTDYSAASALTVTSLGLVSLSAGSIATTDTLEVRAYNGSYWGDWQSLIVAVTVSAKIPAPPQLVTQTPSIRSGSTERLSRWRCPSRIRKVSHSPIAPHCRTDRRCRPGSCSTRRQIRSIKVHSAGDGAFAEYRGDREGYDFADRDRLILGHGHRRTNFDGANAGSNID